MIEFGKLVGYLLSPLTIAFLLAIGAWAIRMERPAAARGTAVCAFLVLWIGAMPMTADLLSRPLETAHPILSIQEAPKADAIVLLGGSMVPAHPPHRPDFGLGTAADRVWKAAALYRAGKAPRIVVAGGNLWKKEGLQVEAEAVAQLLVAMGVPAEAIVMEGASRTTLQNAANTRSLLQQQKVRSLLLVTSAQHLPRAAWTFQKGLEGTGVRVFPFPADVGSRRDFLTVWAVLPHPDALRHVTNALKEYAGMAVLAIM